MSAPSTVSGKLDAHQRRTLLGICLVVGAATVVPATYNYVLDPMLEGLGASESQSSLLRQLPSIAALLVIFLAGVLGGRWGARRLISVGAVLFTVGCAAVALAPAFPAAVAGLVIESIGASALLVVALGLLSSSVSDSEARASAFATFAIVAPLVYTTSPLIAGAIVDTTSWRLVPVLWALGGLVMLWSARTLLPADHDERDAGELVTPALAGLVLASAVQTINSIHTDGWTATSTLVRIGITAAALVALIMVFRRSAAPTLSTAALKQGGMLILLVVVIIIPFANLWFYATMGFQYVYGLSVLQTAVVMIPAQLAGVLGAVLARRLIQRRGITTAGFAALMLLAISLLLSCLLQVDTPIALAVAIVAVYGIASVGAGIPLTNSIMDTAPPGEDGSAAAFRGAASNLGSAVGVIVMTTIVFGVISTSLTNQLTQEGLASQQSADIAAQIRDGATSESVASDYAVPVQEVDQISDAQRIAMVDGLHAQGAAGAAFISVGAVIFLVGRRRQDRTRRAEVPAPV